MSIIADEEMLRRVKKHIRGGASQATYAAETKHNKSYTASGGSCHGYFMDKFDNGVKYSFLATSVGFDKGTHDHAYQEGSQDYIRWILSKESPWYPALKDNFEIIYQGDSGPASKHIRGIILGPEVFNHDNTNHSHIYNFLLASRTTRGYVQWMRDYHNLRTKLGLNEFQSMVMMPYFSLSGTDFLATGIFWSANACAIREGCASDGNQVGTSDWAILDIDALKKGEYNFNPPKAGPVLTRKTATSYWSSYGWLKRNVDKQPVINSVIPKNTKVVKSRFTSVSCVDEKQIVEYAEKFLK